MQKIKEDLKCNKCGFKGVYFRESKELHFKCKRCGNEFNIKEN